MKQFNLEEYLKNPSRKVVTRDGRKARILCTDVKRALYPVLALVDNGSYEVPASYTKNGEYYTGGKRSFDLLFGSEKHERVAMNENLDLTKILEGCPVGTEFYSSIYGKVWLVCIDLDSDYPIRFSVHNDNTVNASVTPKGTHLIDYNGECVFFPSKDQRDWRKFERFWDKPKVEKFNVNTLHPFDKVLVRADGKSIWEPDFFGYKDDNYDACVMCISDRILVKSWEQCIPYNEETKHLVGTREDCPEYYKWWEE